MGGTGLMARASIGVVLVILCSVAYVKADAVDCSVPFNNMQPCIEYVNSNTAAAPSDVCCTAFANTHEKEPVCLCQLLQAFSDPATAPGNATRAMQIPALCKVNVDSSKCPGLLGLAPTTAPVKAPAAAPPVVVAPAATPLATPAEAPVAAAPVAAGPAGSTLDCSNEFAELQPCFTYVTANDTTPPEASCCTALGTVVKNRPVCLCQLLSLINSGDPNTAGINATKGLELPTVCKVKADVNKCPALLGSPVSSPATAAPTGTPNAEAPVSSPPASVGGESTPGPTAPAPEKNDGSTTRAFFVTTLLSFAVFPLIF